MSLRFRALPLGAAALALTGALLVPSAPALATGDVAPVVAVEASARTGEQGWVAEGGSWAYYEGGVRRSGWVVSDAYPEASGSGLQRYWLGADGLLVRDALVEVGDGTWAYARPEGYVVRGSYARDGVVYLADNDGRLLSPGWQVTDVVTGSLERYYVDPETHAARTGFFAVDGRQYFASAQTGLVVRNVGSAAAPLVDNDGVIHASGWVVTDAFGGALDRYWFGADGLIAEGLVEVGDGTWAYARPDGPVVRGKWADPATGAVYLANNDGALEAPGWLVTASYDGAAQRYYVDETTHACRTGLFTYGNRYYGIPGAGYVLRGTMEVDGQTLVADNDGALVPTFETTVATAEGSSARVVSTYVDLTPHLFLPAHADLSSLTLSFPSYLGKTMLVSLDGGATYVEVSSGSAVDLSALPAGEDGSVSVLFRYADSTVPHVLTVMVSDSVRALYLVSDDPVNEGRPFVDGSPDHSAKAKGSALLVNPDGTVVYDGELSQIKGRGNSTWGLSDKKPYQIKLEEKCDLLQTGNDDNRNKTWVLLANATDSSRLRNTVAYDLALALGLSTAPECAAVDLYYDGEYRGSYLLSEKAEINDGRVDIHKLEDDNEEANPGVELDELPLAQGTNRYGQTFQYAEGMADPADISGGYLMELDISYYQNERCWFTTTAGAFVVKEPENLSYAQMLYISERMQEAINASDPELAAPGTRASDYIDVGSFAQTYMVNQFSKNIDWHASSAYYYLPAQGDAEKRGLRDVIYAGPVWDFDTAFGIRSETADAAEWRDTAGLLFEDDHRVWFVKCPEVEQAVARIAAERGNALAAALGSADGTSAGIRSVAQMAAELEASEAMDEVLWGYEVFENCIEPYQTYEENVRHLSDWVAARASWLASNGWS